MPQPPVQHHRAANLIAMGEGYDADMRPRRLSGKTPGAARRSAIHPAPNIGRGNMHRQPRPRATGGQRGQCLVQRARHVVSLSWQGFGRVLGWFSVRDPGLPPGQCNGEPVLRNWG